MRDYSIYVAKTDQLRGYYAADLHICFRKCKNRISHYSAQIEAKRFHYTVMPTIAELLEKQSDQGIHCLPFYFHHLVASHKKVKVVDVQKNFVSVIVSQNRSQKSIISIM